jgi:tetratricopeptide (TPR) repeat protein
MTMHKSLIYTLIYLSNIIEKHYNKFPTNVQNEFSLNEILEMWLDDLKKYLKYVSPKITSLAEWGNWREKCHKLRNEVVHKRKKPDVNEAQNALYSSKILLEILKTFSYNEEDWILEAIAFIHDKEKAKHYFNNSILVKPHPDAYYYLGHIEFEAKNYDIAINHFREGVKLINDPFFKPHFYFYMGKCYEDQRLYNEAIKEYDESISLIEQADKEKRNFLIRHPHNNPYYRKYMILTKQNLKYKSNDMVKLFNALLEVFHRNSEFQKLRDAYSKSN